MNKLTSKIMIVAFGAFLSFPAMALDIEPYAGFVLSGSDNSTPSSDVKGVMVGGRVGFSTMGFGYGADVEVGIQDVKATGASIPWKTTKMGLYGSFTFPVLIRLYATYFLSAKGEYEVSAQTLSYTGSGYKLGVGYTGFPLISINLEMAKDTYGTCSPSASCGSTDYEADTTILSVSLPL